MESKGQKSKETQQVKRTVHEKKVRTSSLRRADASRSLATHVIGSVHKIRRQMAFTMRKGSIAWRFSLNLKALELENESSMAAGISLV